MYNCIFLDIITSTGVMHRLLSGRAQVNDREPTMCKPAKLTLTGPALLPIRTPMRQYIAHLFQAFNLDISRIYRNNSCDTTHVVNIDNSGRERDHEFRISNIECRGNYWPAVRYLGFDIRYSNLH